MRIQILAAAAVAAALTLPGAALAGVFDPNVINGIFFTQEGGPSNELRTEANLGFFDAAGEIICGTEGVASVIIDYATVAPDKASTSDKNVKIQDKSQIDVRLTLDTAGDDFDGSNVIDDCKLSSSLKGKAESGVDTVQGAKAKLSCNLGDNFSLLTDEGLPPTTENLEAVTTLCADRKDVKIDTEKGTLDISHDGTPVLLE